MNVIGYLFSFLTLPLLISKYGLKDIGVVFTIQVLVLGIASIANYSLTFYIPTISKELNDSKLKLLQFWNLALSIRSIIALLLGFLSILFVYYYFNELLVMWLFGLTLLLPKIINPVLFCNALEKNDYVFKIGFFAKLLFLIFIYFSDSIDLVNMFLALSELIVILFFLPRISPSFLKIQFVGLKAVVEFFKKTLNLFLVNLFSHLKTVSILPMIAFLLGSEYAALYTLVEKVMNVMRSISGSMFVSFFPIYNKEKMTFNFFSVKNIGMLLLLSFIVIILIWNLSPTIIYYLNDYRENQLATKTLQVFSLSIPMFFIIIPLFSYLLEFKKWNAILVFAIIQLLVLYLLILLFHQNIVQIALTFIISEYTLLFMYYFYVIRLERLNN